MIHWWDPRANARAAFDFYRDIDRDVRAIWRVLFTPEPPLGCRSNDEIDAMEVTDGRARTTGRD